MKVITEEELIEQARLSLSENPNEGENATIPVEVNDVEFKVEFAVINGNWEFANLINPATVNHFNEPE